MILVTGHVQFSPSDREEGRKLGCEHSRRSRAEPGCIAHHCLIDAENPDRVVFLEEWADFAALQRHFAVPESGEFVRRITALSVEAPVMRIFVAKENPDPSLQT